jgi:hypothetical protein
LYSVSLIRFIAADDGISPYRQAKRLPSQLTRAMTGIGSFAVSARWYNR